MARATTPPKLRLPLLYTFIFAFYIIQGLQGSRTELASLQNHLSKGEQPNQGSEENKKYPRRLMIGSTAPTCTYNECRGCKYKCRAEQVPVEGNDPINSAYHYRCVCHR